EQSCDFSIPEQDKAVGLGVKDRGSPVRDGEHVPFLGKVAMPGVHPGLEEFQRFTIGLDHLFRREALDTLEAPIAEKRRGFGDKLIFLVAAVLASLDLIDPAIRRHNPTVRAQAAIISGPVRIDDIDLSPAVTTGIRNSAICTAFCLRPATVKILHVVKFRETPAIGADEYQRVRKKPDPAGLIEDKLSLIHERLVLVIQECSVDALLRQNSWFATAVCGTLEPALDVFSEVFKQLLLDCRRRRRDRCADMATETQHPS